MKKKIRMAAEKLSAPFRFVGRVVKKPFVEFYNKHEKGSSKTIYVMKNLS